MIGLFHRMGHEHETRGRTGSAYMGKEKPRCGFSSVGGDCREGNPHKLHGSN